MFSWIIWTLSWKQFIIYWWWSWWNNSSYIGGDHDENIGSWFYYDCHLIGCWKNYL